MSRRVSGAKLGARRQGEESWYVREGGGRGVSGEDLKKKPGRERKSWTVPGMGKEW